MESVPPGKNSRAAAEVHEQKSALTSTPFSAAETDETYRRGFSIYNKTYHACRMYIYGCEHSAQLRAHTSAARREGPSPVPPRSSPTAPGEALVAVGARLLGLELCLLRGGIRTSLGAGTAGRFDT